MALYAKANYKYEAQRENELTFEKGDVIKILKKKGNWWKGQVDSRKGYFPYNYVELLPRDYKSRSQNGGGKRRKDKKKKRGSKERSKTVNTRKKTTTAASSNAASPKTDPLVRNPDSLIPRARRLLTNYVISSTDAYDSLQDNGYALETLKGEFIQKPRKTAVSAQPGMKVTLEFSAYVWDPQSETLREFASSDKLAAPPMGVPVGKAGSSGKLLEFVVGKDETIEGLDAVVRLLDLNSRVRAIISPEAGYGDDGFPPEIPGDCFLVYDLALLKVEDGNGPVERAAVFSVGVSKPKKASKAITRKKQFEGYKSAAKKKKVRKRKKRTKEGSKR